MAKLSPIEQIEKYLQEEWEYFFGALHAPNWIALLDGATDPSLLGDTIEDTFTVLKKGKLGKNHALVTFSKIIAANQYALLKEYAEMVGSHQREVKQKYAGLVKQETRGIKK
jgi:hypothetical protein